MLFRSVLPLVGKVLAALNGWLPDLFGPDLRVQVDADNIPALSSEREALWKRVAASDFLTDDEKRQMLGLPKLADLG